MKFLQAKHNFALSDKNTVLTHGIENMRNDMTNTNEIFHPRFKI